MWKKPTEQKTENISTTKFNKWKVKGHEGEEATARSSVLFIQNMQIYPSSHLLSSHDSTLLFASCISDLPKLWITLPAILDPRAAAGLKWWKWHLNVKMLQRLTPLQASVLHRLLHCLSHGRLHIFYIYLA